MKISKHIEEQHNGNISAFARSQGVKQNQAVRWIKRDCMVVDNIVYCQVSKHIKENK